MDFSAAAISAPFECDAALAAFGHLAEPDLLTPKWDTNIVPASPVTIGGSAVGPTDATEPAATSSTRVLAFGPDPGGGLLNTVTGPEGTSQLGFAGAFDDGAVRFSRTETSSPTGGPVTARENTFAIDPSSGAMSTGFMATKDGNGAGGSFTAGPEGLESVTGSVRFRAAPEGPSFGGSLTAGDSRFGVSGNARYGIVGVGANATTVFGDIEQQVVTEPEDPAGGLLGGDGYLSTTRRDATTIGGSLGIGPVGAAAKTGSESALELIERLPPGWETMTADERAAHQQRQETALANLGGLGDLDASQLSDGQGVRYTTSNGWNASAGVSYGLVSANAGAGGGTAHDVTLVRTGDQISVTMTRQEGETSTAGVAVAGAGIDVELGSTDGTAFELTVDANNPAAMAELQRFLETGLLPGASQIQDPEAQAAFATARATVDETAARIRAIEDQIAASALPDQVLFEREPDLVALRAERDAAQVAVAAGRDALNDRWRATYGVEGDNTPMDGIAVTQETATHQETRAASLVGIEVARTTSTWVDQDYIGAQGNAESRHGYARESTFFGHLMSAQAMQADTDQAGIALGMSSYNEVDVDNYDLVAGMSNTNVPAYVAESMLQHGSSPGSVFHRMSGTTSVALSDDQVDVMTGSLNNMAVPASAAMWNDFGVRTQQYMAGENFVLPTGNAPIDHIDAVLGDRARHDWLAGIARQDPATNPVAAGLHSFAPGGAPDEQMAAAGAVFATVKTPEAFQALPADQQLLYIAVLGQTSGGDDLTGRRSSYEAIGPISLLDDEELRTSKMRDLFAADNEEAIEGGGDSDGALNFVRFTERLRTSDPAAHAAIAPGIAFHWSQPGVDEAAALSSEDMQAELVDAQHDSFGPDEVDPRRSLELVQAANLKGGPRQIGELLTATGTDPSAMLQQLADDPDRQHMMYDLLVAAGHDPATLAGAGLAFDPATSTAAP